MKNIKLILLSGLLLLVGCGDMFMKEKESKKISSLLTCQADPAALGNIFSKNIKGEFVCLEENLNLFVEMVESQKPGFLGFKELSSFMSSNMNVDPAIIGPLKGLFELNSLMSGDETMYIKKENIKGLIEMLALINKVMVEHNVYRYFTDTEQVDYQEHARRKAEIFNAFTAMEKGLYGFFKDNNNTLNLPRFLKRFENVDNAKSLRNSQNLLFIKKIFLGGDKETLSAAELKRLMLLLADASKVAYDAYQLPNLELTGEDKEEVVETLKEDFETIGSSLYINSLSQEPVMSVDDVLSFVEERFPGAGDISEYREAILQAKGLFLNDANPSFSGEELHTLFNDIILRNLKKGVFFYKAYSANSDILDSPAPIYRELPHVLAGNSLEKQFKADFNRIAKDYWFFLDSNLIAPYKNEIERSPWGMFAVAVMEDLVARVFSNYSEEDKSSYLGYKMSREKIQSLLEDFKRFLNKKGLILPGREANSAETIELMTALFQKQSDGKGNDIEVNEMVEFLTTMASGYSFSSTFYNEVSNVCRLDEKGRVSDACLRDHFLWSFEMKAEGNERKFGEYFPKLASYAQTLEKDSSDAFVNKLNSFTRTCSVFEDGTSVPLSKGDLFLFFTGLLNMESTFTVFDRRGSDNGTYNNMLEVSELGRAFDQVFEAAIKAKVPKMLDWRAKDVFFYLLDKGEEPSSAEMIFRIVPAGYPRKSADRDAIASVLRAIAAGSETNKKNPFNCEALR